MDRTYVSHQQKTPVVQLGLELWRDHVVRQKKIAERLLDILLDMVVKERGNELIAVGLFRNITQVGGASHRGSGGGAGGGGGLLAALLDTSCVSAGWCREGT